MHFCIISLFNNNSRASFDISYLSSTLKKFNHDCSLLFLVRAKVNGYIYKPIVLPTDEEADRIIKKLECLRPDMVGINVYYPFLHAAIRLTKEIKNRLKIPVIWGGIYPTVAPEECIQFADLICIGEGEEVILELAGKMQKGSDISQINNLWIKKNNFTIRNDVRPLIQDLDRLPFPDFDSKDRHYICVDGVCKSEELNGQYNIISSRGCLFSCSYCSENIVRRIYNQGSSGHRSYRMRSPENVIAELKEAKDEKTVKFIHFHDALFTSDSEWIKRFSYLYKKEIAVPFGIRSSPMLIKKDNMDLLVDAGLYYLGMSIESGSERIRREIFHRPITDSMHREIQNNLLGYKHLKIVYNFIVDNPFETEEDKDNALNFLFELTGNFSINVNSLTFYPKTDITEMALKSGKISQPDLLLAMSPSATSIILNQKRRLDEKFWISLVFLFILYHKFHFYPKRIIYLISKSSLLRKHPQSLFVVMYYLIKVCAKLSKIYFRLRLNFSLWN